MDAEKQVLRIGIEGRWEANEFAQSLSALDRLYTLRFGLALEKQELIELRDVFLDAPFPPFSRSLRYLRHWTRVAPSTLLRSERAALVAGGRITSVSSELLEPDERLVVQRVIYGSPGIKDLAGVGEIVGHLKDLLLRLIDHWSTKQRRSLENRHLELENERLELENRQRQVEVAKQFVGLAGELGYTEQERRQLVAAVMHEQQPIVTLISAGKITSVDAIDETQP